MTNTRIQFSFFVCRPRWGLIRKRSTNPRSMWAGGFYPEIWQDGRWVHGSPYVVDALTGMGEDPWSCGEYSEEVDLEAAAERAEVLGIDLFADNPVDPHTDVIADQAREFAILAHGDQLYGKSPYITHLDDVATLLHIHQHREAVAAGYLHDILEDTSVGREELEQKFSADLTAIVAFCTDEHGRNRKERKKATYKRMRQQIGSNYHWLPVALATKVADRLANVEASVEDSPDRLKMYRDEFVEFRDVLFRPGTCDSMWEELDRLLGPKGNRLS